ncbi:MAG TPA: cyclic nucleotide-binding domain-containing protein [Myxococcales bacterium]|nr:cyclic nucleotide-binding domain-containing protein [Myxococcales bacterium]
MAKKPQVDVRKLKDEVTEYLKKSKFEKAAEVLEQLVQAEPKDMSHRLKLGDTYRRMEQVQKAIIHYTYAARFFSDEGQLIKGIGAVKIILEIDPKNEDAQTQLEEMNDRRFGKVTLESAGLKAKAGIGAGARATSAIELEEASAAADAVGSALHQPELEAGDDEPPLELDDGKPTRPMPVAKKPAIAPGPPTRAIVPPPPKKPPVYDLGEPQGEELDLAAPAPQPPKKVAPPRGPPVIAPPPPEPEEVELDLGGPGEPEVPERLPDDAILEPQAEDLIAPPEDEKVISGPIADLLSSEAEEEVELLSISSDEEAAGERPHANPKLSPDQADLDAAFDKMAPAAHEPPKPQIKKVPLFDDLSQDAFVALVNKLSYHRHVPGQLIIKEGDPGRSFFIIVEGKVRIYKSGGDDKEITLAHLGEGAFFGEMALLSGAPRTANVVAEEDTEILEVTDTVLRELAGKYPQVVSSLKNFYRQRLLNNVMAISPLFKDFDPSERKAIAEKFKMKQAADREVLITEGKNSDGLYVVLHGSVLVAKLHTHPVELARLKEGDIFGEMSLLTRKPATATVSSQGNSILLRLPRENFQELVLTHPQILELVSELTEKRKSATEAILQGQGEGHDGMSFV